MSSTPKRSFPSTPSLDYLDNQKYEYKEGTPNKLDTKIVLSKRVSLLDSIKALMQDGQWHTLQEIVDKHDQSPGYIFDTLWYAVKGGNLEERDNDKGKREFKLAGVNNE